MATTTLELLNTVKLELVEAGIDPAVARYIVANTIDKLTDEGYDLNAPLDLHTHAQQILLMDDWLKHSLVHKKAEARVDQNPALAATCAAATPIVEAWKKHL